MGRVAELYLMRNNGNPDKKRLALGYVRVSDGKQMKKGFPSTESQKQYIMDFVKSHPEYTLEGFFEDAKPAKDLKRPGFQQMLERIEKGGVGTIIAYRSDRISRNKRDPYWLDDFLAKRDIKLIYSNDINTDSSPAGNFINSVKISASAYESDLTSVRVAEKHLMEVQQGLRPAGVPPMGYIRGEKYGVLEIHEDSAAHVREIYELFLSGKKPSEIAVHMAEKHGVTPVRTAKSGRLIGGSLYTENQIGRILRNPTYAGYQFLRLGKKENGDDEYKFFNGNHEAIISKEKWEKVQERLSGPDHHKNTSHPNVLASDKYLLKKILYCSCGAFMTVGSTGQGRERGVTYNYYVCTKKAHERSFCKCDTYISKKVIEGIVFAVIGHFFARNPKAFKMADARFSEYEKIFKERSDSLLKEKAYAERKLHALVKCLAEDENAPKYIEEIKKQCKDESDKIRSLDEEHELFRREFKMSSMRINFNAAEFNQLFSDHGGFDEKLLDIEKKTILSLCAKKMTLSRRPSSSDGRKNFTLSITPEEDIAAKTGIIKVDFSVNNKHGYGENEWEIESPFKLIHYGKIRREVRNLKHFLYEVDLWVNEMKREGLTVAEFARKHGMSKSLVKTKCAILNNLSMEALSYIFEITDPDEIESVTCNFLRELIRKPQKLHLYELKKKLGKI